MGSALALSNATQLPEADMSFESSRWPREATRCFKKSLETAGPFAFYEHRRYDQRLVCIDIGDDLHNVIPFPI
jgi:hypothetical protein